jgi:hypothetical protein
MAYVLPVLAAAPCPLALKSKPSLLNRALLGLADSTTTMGPATMARRSHSGSCRQFWRREPA